jgi:predicted transcriptional regulator
LTNYCLNPDNLKKAGAHKAINDSDLLKAMGSKAWVANDLVKTMAEKMEVSDRTVYRYIKRLTNAGKIVIDNGFYSANQATF